MKKLKITAESMLIVLLLIASPATSLYAEATNHYRDNNLWDGAQIDINDAKDNDVADLTISAGVYQGWAGLTAVVVKNAHPDFGDAAGFWWNLHTQGNVDWRGTLTLYYNENDLNGIPENELTLNHYNGTTWVNMGGVINTNANTISVEVGKDDFSPYVVSRIIPPSIIAPVDEPTSLKSTGKATIAETQKMNLSVVAYPNPFSERTTISFTLNATENVSLAVYDMSGRLVRNLLTNASYADGVHQITWDGTSNAGTRVSNGVYLYQLQAGSRLQTERMMMTR